MSKHPDPAESSSTIYVHQPAPLPEGPTMIRDRFWTRRVEEVRASGGIGRAGCRNSQLTMGFPFQIRIDGTLKETDNEVSVANAMCVEFLKTGE